MRISELVPVFIDPIPETLKIGLLYISKEFGTSCHLCPCGCGYAVYLNFPEKTVDNKINGWHLTIRDEKISFRPSIGNTFKCKSHYYITDNKIEWL